MNETLTIRQVLEITANNLRRMSLPVELMDTVGQTVLGCIRNLEACMNAMDEADNGGADDGTDPEAE